MNDRDLARQAFELYYRLDDLRLKEAEYQSQSKQSEKDLKRLLQLMRLCKRAYQRFERRAIKSSR